MSDFMMHFERIEAVRSVDRCDVFWINIHAVDDDAVEGAPLILPFLSRIPECWCDFVEGELWLVGIEEEIFIHLWDVFVIVAAFSDDRISAAM